MLKTIAIVLACSAASFATTYVGRTVTSAPFQLDVPYGSAIKTTVDPGNVWSWYHDFGTVNSGQPTTANVLVDFDGNGVMDTEQPWLRVMVTDIEILGNINSPAIVWILDGQGKRFAAGVGAGQYGNGPVHHVALTSPIVLPVNSPLQVQVASLSAQASVEVSLIGRVVNL